MSKPHADKSILNQAEATKRLIRVVHADFRYYKGKFELYHTILKQNDEKVPSNLCNEILEDISKVCEDSDEILRTKDEMRTTAISGLSKLENANKVNSSESFSDIINTKWPEVIKQNEKYLEKYTLYREQLENLDESFERILGDIITKNDDEYGTAYLSKLCEVIKIKTEYESVPENLKNIKELHGYMNEMDKNNLTSAQITNLTDLQHELKRNIDALEHPSNYDKEMTTDRQQKVEDVIHRIQTFSDRNI